MTTSQDTRSQGLDHLNNYVCITYHGGLPVHH